MNVRVRVRCSNELGAVPAKTSPPFTKVSAAVDERYDDHLARTDPVDQSVIPGEELSVLTIVKLRNRAATIGESRERLRSFQKIGDESGSSRRRFVSETTAHLFQQ